MRFIGSIADSTAASRFGDFLTSVGIANTIEAGASGPSVWVHDDDHLDRARAELSSFTTNPSDARYELARKVARERELEQERKQQALQRNFIDYRTRFAAISSKPQPVTIALVIICALVAGITRFGAAPGAVYEWLSFGRLSDDQLVQNNYREASRLLGIDRSRSEKFDFTPPGSEDILHGQVWRLFTPMFLHAGLMHLVFNMLMLVQLGGAIERRLGSVVMLAMVLATAMFSSLAQFYWAGPNFVGMSGVVYGLFGYIWIKSVIQPHVGFQISRDTVTIMLVWLVLCMTGLLGPIANAAHVGGLLTGMVLAHAPYSWKQVKRSLAARRAG